MLRAHVLLAHRSVLRIAAGPLSPIAVVAERGFARALARVLAPRRLAATTYLRGSLAGQDAVPGLSDLDIALVARSGEHASRVRDRWRRLSGRLPLLARMVHLAVYDHAALTTVAASSALTARRPVLLPPATVEDEANLLVRPGLHGSLRDWRLLSGPERRPASASQDAHERRISAWLELQFCWRAAFWGCTRESPALAHVCLKLVADPARIWLWLAHGERATSRADALERARRCLPEEERALGAALALRRALPASPQPPLGDALGALVRFSDRIARHVAAEVASERMTAVRLTGAPESLIGAPQPLDDLRRLVGHEPRLLPLADWRARAWPLFPDDAFCVTDLDPRDPAALGGAVDAAGGYGPYPALRTAEVMVLAGPGLLRAVQCPLSDPVSFALADGLDRARFADVPGFSAQDCARSALAEHRAWLGADHRGDRPPIRAWAGAQGRTTAPSTDVLGWLLSAARAGLFWESIRHDDPELHLTVAAAAAALDARVGGAGIAGEAAAEYRACRRDGTAPRRPLVRDLREVVLQLGAFAFDAPWDDRAPDHQLAAAS